MKKTLPILALLGFLASCNQAAIQSAVQGQIDTSNLDMSQDIKDDVIPTLDPLEMAMGADCTQLDDNVFVTGYAYLTKQSKTIQFESYYYSSSDCSSSYIGTVTTNYLIKKISQHSSNNNVTRYNIDLLVLSVAGDYGYVDGDVYTSPLDVLDVHHRNYRNIGDTDYMTFEDGEGYVSFPFTYVNSGDNHAQRRSHNREVMVTFLEQQPVPYNPCGGGGCAAAEAGKAVAAEF